MTPFHRVVIVAALCLLAACGGGQERAGARIVLDTVLALKNDPGPGELAAWPQAVVRMSTGGYLVIATNVIGHPPNSLRMLYDAEGRFADSIGVIGSGPGEFRMVADAIGAPDDSIYLLDDGNRRLDILDPGAHFRRSVPLSVRGFALAIDRAGRIAISGFMPQDGGVHAPVHVFNRDGQYIRSFGTPPDSHVLEPGNDGYVASPDGHGGWWTSRLRNGYRLEHWDSSGQRTAVLTPVNDWFPESGPPAARVAGESAANSDLAHAQHGTVDLALDRDGRLWVSGYEPRAGWEGVVKACLAKGPLGFECLLSSWPQLRAPVLDVRDTNGAAVGFLRPPELLHFMQGGLAFGTHQDDDGFWHVTIYRMRLEP